MPNVKEFWGIFSDVDKFKLIKETVVAYAGSGNATPGYVAYLLDGMTKYLVTGECGDAEE